MATAMRVNTHDTLKDVLTSLMGSRVEVTLKSGGSYVGKLAMVGDYLVTVAELNGKEFYDAAVVLSEIAAVEARVRDHL